MTAVIGVQGTVVLVDVDGRLTAVADGLRQGGIEDVETVPTVDAIDTVDGDIACVLVPDATADGARNRIDSIELLQDVRQEWPDIPIGVYVLGAERDPVLRLLRGGADTVIGVPPERSALLARRIQHLAGDGETESLRQQYVSLLDNYPTAVYLKDCAGRIVNITDYAFTGYDDRGLGRDDVVGLTDYELFDEGLADSLFEEEQEVLAREEPIGGKIEHYVEDGEDRWVSTTKYPRYSEDGELLGLVGDVHDVTDIKRQERMMARLHEASRRLVRTESKADVAEIAVDIAADMAVLPRARVDLYDDETASLRTVAAVEDESVRWDDDAFQRAATTGLAQYRTPTGEFVAVEHDDHDHEMLELPEGVEAVSGLRIPLGDHGVLGLDTDAETIDDDRTLDAFTVELAHVLAANVEAALDRAEQQRQLAEQNERLEEFALLGSHELRNRLQIALGSAERARAQEDISAVDDVVETLGRMNRLVTQLLTLARTGAVSQATQSMALSGTAKTVWSGIDSGDATLDIDSDGIVTANRDGLLEVFEMLFRTAVDGGGSEYIRIETTDDGFVVADNGSAIDTDQHDGLFDPTYTAVDGGSGDSIYLVSVIADAHDWTVSVQRDGAETQFVFSNVDIDPVE